MITRNDVLRLATKFFLRIPLRIMGVYRDESNVYSATIVRTKSTTKEGTHKWTLEETKVIPFDIFGTPNIEGMPIQTATWSETADRIDVALTKKATKDLTVSLCLSEEETSAETVDLATRDSATAFSKAYWYMKQNLYGDEDVGVIVVPQGDDGEYFVASTDKILLDGITEYFYNNNIDLFGITAVFPCEEDYNRLSAQCLAEDSGNGMDCGMKKALYAALVAAKCENETNTEKRFFVREQFKRPNMPVITATVAAISAIIMLSVFAYDYYFYTEAKDKMMRVAGQYALVAEHEKTMNRMIATERKVAIREKIIRELRGQTIYPNAILITLGKVVPVGARLTDVTVTADGKITINGTATDEKKVVTILQKLRKSDLAYCGISLGEFRRDGDIVKFRLVGSLEDEEYDKEQNKEQDIEGN